MTSTPVVEENIDHMELPPIPALFSHYPPIRDELETESSRVQDETIEECLPFLTASEYDLNVFGVPQLRRAKHVHFLTHALTGKYPAPFVAMDASRAWIPYWSLTGLYALGEDVDEYRERVASTYAASQNPTGGFGGGHGQFSHLAAAYAAVLSIATVGGSVALDLIDRKAMWHWLGQMKQADGGFTMSLNGEEDIRGAYCAITIHSLLSLPLDLPTNAPARSQGLNTFLDGLCEWVSSCQTFEGGIADAPTHEAHGAFAFCGLACLCIVGPPKETLPKYLNLPALLAWLSSRQYAPEGGFSGRTNKLVDGCYSHWVGGCWSLLEAALLSSKHPSSERPQTDLWCRDGLARYILSCAQSPKGGLRDKPSKNVDAYHSCYNLAGLSWAQNYFSYQQDESKRGVPLSAPYGWKWMGGAEGEGYCWEERDRVRPLHPVFVMPIGRAEECRAWFEGKDGF